MVLIRDGWRAARSAILIAAMIAGARGLALAQSGAAAGVAIAPVQTLKAFPAETPRTARRGERIRVIPIDMLQGDESFDDFKRYLEDAIKRRDAQAVYRVVSRDFETHSMDDDLPHLTPFEQFKRTALLEAKNSNLTFDYWRTLDDALRFGTIRVGYARLGTVYCGPAFINRPELPDHSPDNAFVLGDNVPMRKRPDSSTPAIAMLSWEVIRAPDWPDLDNGYVQIVTRDNRSGWVDGRFVRQLYQPTFCFGREQDGDWSIKAIDVNDD